MEEFLLNLGFGWTMSKVLSYVLFLILGMALFLLFRKKVSSRVGKVLLTLIIVAPLGIYFAINPIYTGDFSNDVTVVKSESSFQFAKDELTVLAIPNCPYCAGAIDQLNKMEERTGIASINFVVIASDNEALSKYQELAHRKIEMMAVSDYNLFADITKGRFPTFVYAQDDKLNIWHSDEFGVRAMDWVEEQLDMHKK